MYRPRSIGLWALGLDQHNQPHQEISTGIENWQGVALPTAFQTIPVSWGSAAPQITPINESGS